MNILFFLSPKQDLMYVYDDFTLRQTLEKWEDVYKRQELTEDSQKTMEEDVQKLTDKYIKNIDAAVEEKQKEIMSV